MYKTLLPLAVAALLAAPAGAAGLRLDGAIGDFGDAVNREAAFTPGHGRFAFQSGSVSRLPGKTQRPPPPSPEQVVAPLGTAARARLLVEADQATRKAFAEYQAALAKAKAKGDAPRVAANAVLAIPAASAPYATLKAIGDDMSTAAVALQEPDRKTRGAFGKFTAALDHETQLAAAAGTEANLAAFGVDISAPAQPAVAAPAAEEPAQNQQ